MVYEILQAEHAAVEAAAKEAIDRRVESNPRGFETYEGTRPSREMLRKMFSGYDLDEEELEMLRDEVGSIAIEYLRRLEREGAVVAVTAVGGTPELRHAMREASHPLLRLLADVEFGCARSAEVEAALDEATTLPGWDAKHPAIARYAI